MKMNRQIILMVCGGTCLLGLLTGCSTISKEKIANSATDYNLIVEKTQNEMLLLNIVRASVRHPMYFTTSTKLTGGMTYSFESGSINIPFGKFGTDASAVYSVAPKVSYSTNPIIDVAVLNTKEFTRVFQTPVTIETLNDYWKQGWRKEILLHLFVRSMKVEWKEYVNSPEEEDQTSPTDRKKFNDFQTKLREMLGPKKLDCRISKKETSSDFGPKIKAEVDLETLIKIEKAKLTLTTVANGYQLQSKQTEHIFECNGHRVELHLRSPEAMLYYLGEIMRAQATDPKFKLNIEIEGCNAPVQLFDARKSTDIDKYPYVPYVIVNYKGDEYVIPKHTDSYKKCDADRSMQVLSLISLLLDKQISSGELPPPTGVVTTTK